MVPQTLDDEQRWGEIRGVYLFWEWRCPARNPNLVLSTESIHPWMIWYHSWHDHDPSLTQSNQFYWMDEQWWNALHGSSIQAYIAISHTIRINYWLVYNGVMKRQLVHHPIKKIKDRCGDTHSLCTWIEKGYKGLKFIVSKR